MKKRVISLMLAILMLVGIFPADVCAAAYENSRATLIGSFCNGSNYAIYGEKEYYSNGDAQDYLYVKSLMDNESTLVLEEHVISMLISENTLYLLVYREATTSALIALDLNTQDIDTIASFNGLVENISKRDHVLYFLYDGKIETIDLFTKQRSTLLEDMDISLFYLSEYNVLKFRTSGSSSPSLQAYNIREGVIENVLSADVSPNAVYYTPRVEAPATDNPYYTTLNIFHQCGYGMAPNVGNCTCYAFGRSYENLGKEPKLSHGNAGKWYDYNKQNGYYPYGSSPVLGAVAVWKKPGGAGHVAIVEVIDGDTVITSESGWKSFYFKTVTRSKSHSNFSQASSYSFQGFIYVLGTDVTNQKEPSFMEYVKEEYPCYVRVTTQSTYNLWNMPCSDSTSADAEVVAQTKADGKYVADRIYKNTADNYWYRIKHEGKVYYLYSKNTSSAEQLDPNITVSGLVVPRDLTQGKSFNIEGRVSSPNLPFHEIGAYIYQGDQITNNFYTSSTDRPGDVTSYDIKSGAVNQNLRFGQLPEGTYTYLLTITTIRRSATGNKLSSQPEVISLAEHVFTVGGHTCDQSTFVYYEASHPHYNCYRCSVCGAVSRKTSETNKLNTCDQCRPGKGVLNVSLSSDGTATFTWANTTNTTHYNVWLHKKNADGTWSGVEQVFYAESGFQRTFGEGEYRAQLLTYSSEMWEPDGKDWVHTWADDVFFTVSDGTYTVSYNANGGSSAPSSQTETVGMSIDLSWSIPTRFGYSFQGWATDSSASSVVYWPGDVYTDDISVTLYAVWREAEVLSGNNVDQFDEAASINCPNAGVYYAFVPNADTGYRIMSESNEDTCMDLFDANGNLIASDDDSGDGTNFLLTFNFTANETYYIYVRYYSSSLVGTIDFKVSERYYVSYDANGGTGAPETHYHFYDEEITLSTEEPTRPGYFFMGWSTEASAIDPQYLPGWVISGNHNLTLYAIWMSDPHYIPTYTVSYNANGGTNPPYDQVARIGSSLEIPYEYPSRFGYNFLGWSINRSASSAEYLPGEFYSADVDITLYAVWEESEVFSGEGVGNFEDTAYIDYADASVCYTFIPDSNAEYCIASESDDDVIVYLYDVDGNQLAEDDDSGDMWNFRLTYHFSANETYYIYVRFCNESLVGSIDFSVSKAFSITYDANGGTGAPETQYHFFDEYVTLSTNEPTRSGYFFDGWAESPTATEPQYFPGDDCNRNADLVLYAIWKTEPTIIASGICGIDLVWTLTRNGCLTISGTGDMFDFEEFENPWSEYILDIKRVVIEPGATSIGEFAFQPCLYLTDVQIPDSVSSIEAFAFRDCASLSELVLPSGLTNIGMDAFTWCSSLSSITIPATVNLIADGAFSRCDNLTQITFKGNAPIIEEEVFFYVTAEAYYPANNPTWTADVMQDYGGTIAWIPYQAMSFTDVAEGSFYYEPVMWAVENGVTSGTSATTFDPSGLCLRAHVVTFLYRAAGSPAPNSTKNPFTDVKSGDFYYNPVLWAVENGITQGVSKTQFGSTQVCNRAAVVTFLWRAFGSPEPKSTNNPFVDVKNTDFFYKPVLWAVENGITAGIDATHFNPAGACNRAQVVTFLYRAYN